MNFSADGKYLITQTGSPDWTLTLWAWEKPKLLSSIKTANPSTDKNAASHTAAAVANNTNFNLIYSASINPNDSGQIAVIGHGIIKILRYQEGSFKTMPIQKTESKVRFIDTVFLYFLLLELSFSYMDYR